MTHRTLYPIPTWIAWVLVGPLLLVGLGLAVVALSNDETLLFDNPRLWWLGCLVPLAGLVVLLGVTRRRRAMERFASAQLAPLLTARISPARQAMRAALFVAAILMVVAAVIGPRWSIYLEKQKVRGVNVVGLKRDGFDESRIGNI